MSISHYKIVLFNKYRNLHLGTLTGWQEGWSGEQEKGKKRACNCDSVIVNYNSVRPALLFGPAQ